MSLQRSHGNQHVQRLLRDRMRAREEEPSHSPGEPASPAPVFIQAKLAVSHPDDALEREADAVADSVLQEHQPAEPRTASPAEAAAERPFSEAAVGAASRGGGQPLSSDQRAFFEPRFGADFSQVRLHTDGAADAGAREVNALAFTRGSDIVFRKDHYRPDTSAGRRLLAHELTHVVQQGAAPSLQQPSADESAEAPVLSRHVSPGMAGPLVQRWPGDGLMPPGTCPWGTYLPLRAAVESAKAVVSTLGACAPGDSCLFIATKIAAITAEIAARVALDTTCFMGGDAGHRQQVIDKVNMLNRCYRFFTDSECPQKLIEAMKAVVERAREVIAAAAVAIVAVALIVALIVAIIALVEVIVAAIAAAGAAAATAAAAAAVLALLVLVRDNLSEGPPTA